MRRSLQRRLDWRLVALAGLLWILPSGFAGIPWSQVEQRIKTENEKLARRPQGHDGEYFVVCTLYYTPMESGFTAGRGFDVTPVTRAGLDGRKYPRDFLAAVRKEGFGRLRSPVDHCDYIHYDGANSYSFARRVVGRGASPLITRSSAAIRAGQHGFEPGVEFSMSSSTIREIFGSSRWKIADTGGGLRRWQVDLYWGEDEPLGPGRLMTRPRGATFEYEYSLVKVQK